MAARRQAQDATDAIRAEDSRARREQARDAARIHRELAETDRLAAAIGKLLDDPNPGLPGRR